MKLRVAERCNEDVRSVSLGVKRELYELVVIPTVKYGAETWGRRMDERQKLDVMEMKCLRNM